MFNFSISEIVVVLVVALLVVKPKELPALAHYLGKSLAKLRKMTSDIQNSFASQVVEQKKTDLPESHSKNE